MSQSHTHKPAPSRRGHAARESATTAAGIAAERVALADRERERRTWRARIAAREIRRPAGRRL